MYLRTRSYILLLVLLSLCGSGSGALEQKRPSDKPPHLDAGRRTDLNISFYQLQLQRDPTYYLNYNRLASAYIQKARETGDISYYALAEKALQESLKLESSHTEAAGAYMLIAGVHFAEHRFHESAREAQLAIERDPGEVSAYAYAGDAELESGNYAEAAVLFSRIVGRRDSLAHAGVAYLFLTRKAGLDWIEGRSAAAIEEMRQAAQLSANVHLPAENIAWTHFMLGEQMFQSGDLAGAEAEMQASLGAYPSYHRALAGIAQVRAAQLRFDDAENLYRQAINVIPLPSYAGALGDIYHRRRKYKQAERQYELVEYIGTIGTLNRQVYNRELAMFYADHDRHLPEALLLAQKEMEVRHDVYSWDALAWALLKNGRPQQAREAMHKSMATGTRDALLFFHAAAIERQLGQWEKSSEYTEKALAINPEFHVLYANQARQWLRSTHPPHGHKRDESGVNEDCAGFKPR